MLLEVKLLSRRDNLRSISRGELQHAFSHEPKYCEHVVSKLGFATKIVMSMPCDDIDDYMVHKYINNGECVLEYQVCIYIH